MTAKTCTMCGATKPLTDFYRDSKGAQGRRAICAECARACDKARPSRSRRQPVTTSAETCNHPRCTRPAAITSSGLCGPHHAVLSADRESPLALTGGTWVAGVGGVRRWAA